MPGPGVGPGVRVRALVAGLAVLGGLAAGCSRPTEDPQAEKTYLARANAVCATRARDADPRPNEEFDSYLVRQVASKRRQLDEIDRLGPPPTQATAEALRAWRDFLDQVQTSSTSTEPPQTAVAEPPGATDLPPRTEITQPSATSEAGRSPLDAEGEVAATLVLAGFTDCQPLTVRLAR